MNEAMSRAPKKDSKRIQVIAFFTLIALVLGLFGGWAFSATLLHGDGEDGNVWLIAANTGIAGTDSITLEGSASAVVGVQADESRETVTAPISKVVQRWDDVFGDDTPVAVLAGVSGGTTHSVIVELGTPTATADSITFPATPVGSSEIPEFEVQQATLVVDGAGLFDSAEDLQAQG